MPDILFKGGPLDGTTMELPQLTGGIPLTFKTGHSTTEYDRAR